MPTFYQCYLEYQKRSDAIQFSKKKIKKLHEHIKRVYDRHENPPISYLESQEGNKMYLVRDYPARFKNTIVGLLNRLHDNEVKKVVEVPILKEPVKRQRVRKPINKPEFSAKPKL